MSGLALTCIHHEEGHRKILSFHGKGTGNLLYLLAEREETEAGPVIYLSQEELADILAANRVNLSRNISCLRQEGIIATSRKQIRILRPDQVHYIIIIHEIRGIVCSLSYRECSDFSVIQKRDVL